MICVDFDRPAEVDCAARPAIAAARDARTAEAAFVSALTGPVAAGTCAYTPSGASTRLANTAASARRRFMSSNVISRRLFVRQYLSSSQFDAPPWRPYNQCNFSAKPMDSNINKENAILPHPD